MEFGQSPNDVFIRSYQDQVSSLAVKIPTFHAEVPRFHSFSSSRVQLPGNIDLREAANDGLSDCVFLFYMGDMD